ncbi:MAG: flagellar basal body P-ring protein FlgI [Candidatus Saganbacteria bacterium]|nr:flagellar basal body P-ring protein FlgI [Candidatus Saganbacteria bacterium]
MTRKISVAVLFTVLVVTVSSFAASPSVRIKDIATIDQARENQLIGFGLVAGLRQSGDSQQTEFTKQAIANLLSRMGMSPPSPITSSTSRSLTNLYNFSTIPKSQEYRSKNVAAVMVTATLPPFMKPGQKIDVTVASIGDAASLKGGNLLATQLLGMDGQTYAVAQGPVSLGGVSDSNFLPFRTDIATTGRVPGGGLVEKEIPVSIEEELAQTDTAEASSSITGFKILLNEPDFTTASRVAYTIAKEGIDVQALDAASIMVRVTPGDDAISLISKIETLRVIPDVKAKIVINERTGTIVIGENIRIAPVAVTYGNFTVTIGPASLTSGLSETGGIPLSSTNVMIKESNKKLVILKESANLSDLVRSLNSIGATPKDLIAIIQAIKQSGALTADLEIM